MHREKIGPSHWKKNVGLHLIRRHTGGRLVSFNRKFSEQLLARLRISAFFP